MKVSLRWVCDHLSIEWKKINVPKLVAWFNTSVAEIESFETLDIEVSDFALAKVGKITEESLEVAVPEWKKMGSISLRTDAHEGGWYLVKRTDMHFEWATHSDFGIEKDGLLPEFRANAKSAASGSWKKQVEPQDVILDVDNKSITHRPDLWSHRGFAREIAPYLEATLIKEKEFLADLPVKTAKDHFEKTKQFPLSIQMKTKGCKRFAALYFGKIEQAPSALWMAFRLMRVEQRAIDFVVDATNYVMFDIGQPLHAFDAQNLDGHIGPRMAKNGEQLSLLGGLNLTLQSTDMVVADNTQALALAGIKGGAFSGVTQKTESILLESATFSGAVVRFTSMFHKLRSEGSARFEKEQDSYQNLKGITRFVKLLTDAGIAMQHAPYIVSLGDFPKPLVIKITQTFIEDRLGITVKKSQVKKQLQERGFEVKDSLVKDEVLFTVTVPSYRATKDIKQREDIVEELGRTIGYLSIPEVLPVFARHATDQQGYPVTRECGGSWVDRLARLKTFLAFSAHLREVSNYAFLDDEFLKKINWRVSNPIELACPIAEQRTTLVDCPIIPLLQNVLDVSATADTGGFFEWARAWKMVPDHKNKITERKTLSGIVYQRKGSIDFYAMKNMLVDLFDVVAMDISFVACFERPRWAHKYQCADVVVDGKVVGVAAKISAILASKLGIADAFAFDLDGDFLLHHPINKTVFKPFSKYQGSFLDISMMVPVTYTVKMFEEIIAKVSPLIVSVRLQDVFQKAEWGDQKSMTFRYFLEDPQQTVSKDLMEKIQISVCKAVQTVGAVVR